MRYSREHKAGTRRRIVAAAARLFAARGYEATSIDEVMQAAGLTRGAFYRHFASKGALYTEATGQAVALPGRAAEPLAYFWEPEAA